MVALPTGQTPADRVTDEGVGKGAGEGEGEGVGAGAGDEALIWVALILGEGERGARIVSGRVLGGR